VRLPDKFGIELDELVVQRLVAQMRAHHSKLNFHFVPVVSASSNGSSNCRVRRFKECKSLTPGLKNWIGCVETRQLEDAFHLASERTNSKPATLSADLSSGEKQLPKASAGHVIEAFQINEQVSKMLALGQRLDRILQIFSAVQVEPA
jgi:hypothetical protein